MVNSPAPSIRAASRSSWVSVDMYCRMKKIPKALATPGMMRGQNVSIHFRSRMMTKSGPIMIVKGIIIVPSKRTNMAFLPGKRNLANPYPPREQKNSDNSVAESAITNELPTCRRMPLLSRYTYESSVALGERKTGGDVKISSGGFSDVLTIHRKGSSMKTEMPMRKAYNTRFSMNLLRCKDSGMAGLLTGIVCGSVVIVAPFNFLHPGLDNASGTELAQE